MLKIGIISFKFYIFIFLGISIYYLLSDRHRNFWLMFLNFCFIFSYTKFGACFIVLSSYIAYKSGIYIVKYSDNSKKKKYILNIAVISILSILILLKYIPGLKLFSNYNLSIGDNISSFIRMYIYPIGLSYYTLQLISYIIDVYWEKIEAEKSYFKILLFTSYFPSLVQGPISKYSELVPEIFDNKKFCWLNIKFGFQLVLWGLLKKLVIADKIYNGLGSNLKNPGEIYGINLIIVLIYFGIYIYCDFSGGIDIITGISQCFGIKLKPNFRQPYFSLSLGEFWRRWHMSLGEWMKDYVFYPLSVSKFSMKLNKKFKKIVSRKMASRISIGLIDIIVFLFVGLWHGKDSYFAKWGLYNGIILALSSILSNNFVKWKKFLKINESSKLWKTFCLIRTLIIVTLGRIFDCANNRVKPEILFLNLFKFKKNAFIDLIFTGEDYNVIILLVILLFVVDFIHEKNMSIREYLNSKSYAVQFIVWTIVIQIILIFGHNITEGGFMYEKF